MNFTPYYKLCLTLISAVGSLEVFMDSVVILTCPVEPDSEVVRPSRSGKVNCSYILTDKSDLVFVFSCLLLTSLSTTIYKKNILVIQNNKSNIYI